jgi:hypothetical protein
VGEFGPDSKRINHLQGLLPSNRHLVGESVMDTAGPFETKTRLTRLLEKSSGRDPDHDHTRSGGRFNSQSADLIPCSAEFNSLFERINSVFGRVGNLACGPVVEQRLRGEDLAPQRPTIRFFAVYSGRSQAGRSQKRRASPTPRPSVSDSSCGGPESAVFAVFL